MVVFGVDSLPLLALLFASLALLLALPLAFAKTLDALLAVPDSVVRVSP